jgi:hypothetical protein
MARSAKLRSGPSAIGRRWYAGDKNWSHHGRRRRPGQKTHGVFPLPGHYSGLADKIARALNQQLQNIPGPAVASASIGANGRLGEIVVGDVPHQESTCLPAPLARPVMISGVRHLAKRSGAVVPAPNRFPSSNSNVLNWHWQQAGIGRPPWTLINSAPRPRARNGLCI